MGEEDGRKNGSAYLLFLAGQGPNPLAPLGVHLCEGSPPRKLSMAWEAAMPGKAGQRLLHSLLLTLREPQGAQGSGGRTWGFSTGNQGGECYADLKQKSLPQ